MVLDVQFPTSVLAVRELHPVVKVLFHVSYDMCFGVDAPVCRRRFEYNDGTAVAVEFICEAEASSYRYYTAGGN